MSDSGSSDHETAQETDDAVDYAARHAATYGVAELRASASFHVVAHFVLVFQGARGAPAARASPAAH